MASAIGSILREFADKINELDRYEKAAEETKFKCLRTCGYICCTASEVLFNPFDSQFEMTEETLSRLLQFFPAVIPVLGAQSKVPMLVKREMTPCPFYKKDFGCTIHEKKPASCSVYPALRASIYDEKENRSETKVLFMGNQVCPEEAFKEGKTLKELGEELPSMEKTNRLVNEFTEKVRPLIPDLDGPATITLYACRMLKAYAKEGTVEAMRKEVMRLRNLTKPRLVKEIKKLLKELFSISKCSIVDIVFTREDYPKDILETEVKMISKIAVKHFLKGAEPVKINIPIKDFETVIPNDPEMVERANIAIKAAEEMTKRR